MKFLSRIRLRSMQRQVRRLERRMEQIPIKKEWLDYKLNRLTTIHANKKRYMLKFAENRGLKL